MNWPRTIIGAVIVIASLIAHAYVKGVGQGVTLAGIAAGGLMMDLDGVVKIIRAWRGKDEPPNA